MSSIACVIVRSDQVFSWLGHMPILNWCLAQLAEVRGIDRVICCATPALLKQATSLAQRAEGVFVFRIPPSCRTEAETRAWLGTPQGPASGADVVLAISPVNPFLGAPRIEAGLELVAAGKARVVLLGLPATAGYVRNGHHDATTVTVPVPAVTIYAAGADAGPRSQVATVPVTLIEALDVTEPEGLRLANALVLTGHTARS